MIKPRFRGLKNIAQAKSAQLVTETPSIEEKPIRDLGGRLSNRA
jgi:hypothetical protein